MEHVIHINNESISREKVKNILDLTPPFSLKDLKQQYIVLMKKCHPDKSSDVDDQHCKNVGVCYNSLRDYYISLGFNDGDDTKINVFNVDDVVEIQYGKNTWATSIVKFLMHNLKILALLVNVIVVTMKLYGFYWFYNIPTYGFISWIFKMIVWFTFIKIFVLGNLNQ